MTRSPISKQTAYNIGEAAGKDARLARTPPAFLAGDETLARNWLRGFDSARGTTALAIAREVLRGDAPLVEDTKGPLGCGCYGVRGSGW